jgi:hypothetical protein
MTIVDRPIRFYNHHTDAVLLVYSVDAPEPCPQCQRRCCIFLDRRPRPLCLACAADSVDGHLHVVWSLAVTRQGRAAFEQDGTNVVSIDSPAYE